MPKKQTEENKETEKQLKTKYDRKMEARRIREEKERRELKTLKITGIVIAACLAAAVVAAVGINLMNRYTALKGAYIRIGEHDIKGVEFDYYYNNAANNYIRNYGSYLTLLGLDPDKDFAKQEYMNGMTWKDYFDQEAVNQITRIKTLSDDAAKSGFTYDTTEDYQNIQTQIASQADTEDKQVSDLYKEMYGKYATESRIEPFIKEGLTTNAYYDSLLEKNAPAEDEVKAYYEENKNTYDKVDYRSFTFRASLAEDASEEDIAAAMKDLKTKAEEMKSRREKGEDFKELCIEYASDDQKETYEAEDTDASLSEGANFAYISSAYSSWLFDESRKAGDITVVGDDTNHLYYVVEFEARAYDETTDATISNTIASERVEEYISSLEENYPVKEAAGKLAYLKIDQTPATETSSETSSETASETASKTADSNVPADTTADTAASAESSKAAAE